MRDFSALSESAVRLLLHYLDADGETQELGVILRHAGISRSTYYRARTHLVQSGLIDKRGNLLWRPQQTGAPVPLPQPVPVPAALPLSSVEPEPDDSLPIRQRAMQADLMDDSGDWNSSNSPRRKRRMAQIKVVQDAWRELFADGLTADNAKDFLGWNDDSAEQVLEAFTDLKRRADTGYVKTPLQWLRSKYQRRAKDEAAKPKPQVRQAAIGAPETGDVEASTMLSDWTPETKRKMARLEALGLLRTRSEDE